MGRERGSGERERVTGEREECVGEGGWMERGGIVDGGRDLRIHGCTSDPSLARNPGSPLTAFCRACIGLIFGLAV